MKKEMLVNALQPEESRIAIVENGVLEELYIERASQGLDAVRSRPLTVGLVIRCEAQGRRRSHAPGPSQETLAWVRRWTSSRQQPGAAGPPRSL